MQAQREREGLQEEVANLQSSLRELQSERADMKRALTRLGRDKAALRRALEKVSRQELQSLSNGPFSTAAILTLKCR